MKIQRFNHVAIGSGVGLSLLLALLLCPVGSNLSYAEDSSIARSDIDVNVAPTIAVALSNQVSIDVIPKSSQANGSFAANYAELYVSTNSDSGYKILLNSLDGTDLTPTQLNSQARISSLVEPATPANFSDNTWGFYLGSTMADEKTLYQPISTLQTKVADKDTSSELEKYFLTFGTRITTALPADTYSNSVTISAIANPITLTSLRQLTYMQQMTNDICLNTKADKSHPVTKQLIDIRDGKSYWVAKLADQHCWMTQNLDLDIIINEDGTSNIKASDSNVHADWNSMPAGEGWVAREVTNQSRKYTVYDKDGETYYPPTSTETTMTEAIPGAKPITTYSWDFGKWLLATPLAGESCDYSNPENVSVCAEKGIIKLDSGAWRPTYTAQDGIYNNNSTYTAVDQNTNTYDAHYLTGNFYQYNTATAGAGANTVSGHVTESICPKGWTLPIADPSADVDRSFSKLLWQYGVNATAENASTGYNIFKAPLYFIRSGGVRNFEGKMYAPGSSGIWWSSEVTSTGKAMDFIITGSKVVPSEVGDRIHGWSIRCIEDSNI